MYKYVEISKSNFFTITILSLHGICSESKQHGNTSVIYKNIGCKHKMNNVATIILDQNDLARHHQTGTE